VRILMILTSGGVSFFHGMNDGQKGIGLLMIVLVGFLPTQFAVDVSNLQVPIWVILLVALSLGIGTTVGWKNIVVTVGEKIGKSRITYAQGIASQAVAAATIGLSSQLGLPVSTTHVLSSGVAGTMVASGGTQNLQGSTIKNIALAWVLTLPVTIVMAGAFFALFRLFL
jgi:PiT family inorganic phosphate transporter